MGLKEDIQKDVSEMFEKDLDDVPKLCTYTSNLSNPVYDASNQTITPPSTFEFPVRCAIDSFPISRTNSGDKQKDDEEVLKIDRLFITSTHYFTGKPRIGDKVTVLEDSTEWNVIGFTGDPADAHYELHVRPVGA